jgi:hypothetical protein
VLSLELLSSARKQFHYFRLIRNLVCIQCFLGVYLWWSLMKNTFDEILFKVWGEEKKTRRRRMTIKYYGFLQSSSEFRFIVNCLFKKRFAPDIKTNINFGGKCIFNFCNEERLRNKDNIVESGLFLSCKVLNVTMPFSFLYLLNFI